MQFQVLMQMWLQKSRFTNSTRHDLGCDFYDCRRHAASGHHRRWHRRRRRRPSNNNVAMMCQGFQLQQLASSIMQLCIPLPHLFWIEPCSSNLFFFYICQCRSAFALQLQKYIFCNEKCNSLTSLYGDVCDQVIICHPDHFILFVLICVSNAMHMP